MTSLQLCFGRHRLSCMKRSLIGFSLMFTAGCSKAAPSSVDIMCETEDFGYGSPSDDAKLGLDRTNCYRNLMALSHGVLDPLLDAATQSHAEYMATHNTMTHGEDSSKAGYTGDQVWDRIEF